MLIVRFWPFLDHFCPFWVLQGQNLGHPPHRHTPNCAKTSARMSCNPIHAILTVWDHQSAHSQILAIFGPFWPFLGGPGPKFGTPPAQTHSQLCQNLRQCTNGPKQVKQSLFVKSIHLRRFSPSGLRRPKKHQNHQIEMW